MASDSTDPGRAEAAVEIAPDVHWIGAMDPALRSFDMILRTANGTTYNAYAVRGSDGVAVIDTVKAEFSDDFFRRLESIARLRRDPRHRSEPPGAGSHRRAAGADAPRATGAADHLQTRPGHAQSATQAR